MRFFFCFIFVLLNLFGLTQSKEYISAQKNSEQLFDVGKKSDALKVWQKFKSDGNYKRSEYNGILANVYYYTFLKSGDFKYLQKGIEGLLILKKRTGLEINLLLQMNTAYYLGLAEKSQWEKALSQSLKIYIINDFKEARNKLKTDYLYDIGYLYGKCENPYEAIVFYEKSLKEYIKIHGEMNDDVALIYNNLAYSYVKVHNQKYVIFYYKKASEIWEKIYSEKEDKNQYLVTVFNNLNNALLDYGSVEEAQKYNQKLSKLYYDKYQKLKSYEYFSVRQLFILSQVRTQCAINNYDSARIYFDSLESETKIRGNIKEDLSLMMTCFTNLIDYKYSHKKYSETIDLCNYLLPIATRYNLQHSFLLLEAKLSTTYQKCRMPEKALYHVRQALKFADTIHFNSSLHSIKTIKAQILIDLKNYDEANWVLKTNIESLIVKSGEKYRKIDQINNQSLSKLISSDFINILTISAQLYKKLYTHTKKEMYLKRAEKLYLLSSNIFQSYYRKGEYNESLDEYHGRIKEGLLQMTTSKSLDQTIKIINIIENNSSQHLLKEFDKKLNRTNPITGLLYDNFNFLSNELDFYDSKKNLTTDQKKRVHEIKMDLKNIEDKINKTENKNLETKELKKFDIRRAMNLLDNNQQIWRYYVAGEFVYLIVISKNSLDVKKLSKITYLQPLSEMYVTALRNIEANHVIQGDKLYTALIPNSKQNKITIIPENFLNYIPYESLKQMKKGIFFGTEKTITYDYSLSLWLLREEKNNFKLNDKLIVFSPNYLSKEKNTINEFRDLKYAKAEANEIVKLFSGKLFSGQDATKSNFIKTKEKYGIFHFSMHAQLVENDFNKSYLEFSNQEKLMVSEIYAIHLSAELVVLSACNTGNGELKKGEGIMSLSRALIHAGVRSSVVSLWEVPDKETSEIMVDFYKNLKKGDRKDVALSKAKENFLVKNPMKNHPFYWTGFILNGDNSAVVNNSFNWCLVVYISVGLIFTILIIRKLLQIRQGRLNH